jgi:large subunit ribosomal protein L25
VAMDKPIQVTVALHHVGEAIGVRETQGILEMVLREIQVSTLPGNIPELIEADVTKLAIGDVLTVGDLVVPDGVRVLTDRSQAVATVAPPAAEEVAAPVAAVAETVAAAPAEPEVLTERKPKEEAEADDKKAKK